MSAAAKRTVLAVVSASLLGAVILVGTAGGARPGGSRDKVPPSDPTNLHVLVALRNAVVTGWDPSQDNVGVAGYYVYQSTGRATVLDPSYTANGLSCGQSTTISVAAFDRAGNRSSRVPATVATASCVDTQPPTPPSGFQQAATTQNEVVLTWTPSVDDVGVVSYGVYRDLTQIASPAEPTVTLSGLACGSTYSYAVDAADAAGNRSLLANAYVHTATCSDGQPPSAPTGLAVTGKTQTSVSVAWLPSSDDVGVAGYHVRRGGTLVATGTQTNATVFNLVCGATYTIAVDAFDAAGNQSPQTTTSATTDACTPAPPPPPPPTDTSPPSQPSGLAVSATSPTSVALTWAASSDDVGVSGYGVYVNGSSVSTVTQPAATVLSLTCATTYTFEVDAYDAAGNRSARAALSAASASCSAPPPPPPPADTSPPSKPILALGPQTQTTLELDWQAATDNVGIDHYNVWLGHSGSSDFAKIAQVPAAQLSYVYQGLTCATAYTLGLEAVDAAGNKSAIDEATWGPVSTLACSAPPPPPPPPPSGDTTPPSQPANLGISSATRTSVSLTWTASTDNVGVSGYGTYLNSVAGPTSAQPAATVSGLTCGTAYTFEVDAYDAAGNHSARSSVIGSTAACVDTQPPSAPANVVAGTRTATSIALSWSASSDNVGVTGYGLYRAGSQTGTTITTNGIFSGLTCNTNYTLAVDAYDAAANHSTQTVVMVSTTGCPDTTPPSAPTNLAASNVSQSGLTLTWSASTDNIAVTGYDVYQNTTKMATVSATSSAQSGLACGTSYAFAVVARDAAGNSSAQAQLSASTVACSAPPPPPPPASATLYVSPTGNDANACTQASPCGTFNRAYAAAACGSLVEVASGSYPAQAIAETNTGSACATPITFHGTATVDFIQFGTGLTTDYSTDAPDNIVLDGFKVTKGILLHGDAKNIVLDHIDGGSWLVSGAQNVTIKDSDWGPCDTYGRTMQTRTGPAEGHNRIEGCTDCPTVTDNVVIENNVIHDFTISGSAHSECVWINGGRNVTFRGNKIYNCTTTAMSIGEWGGELLTGDWYIENNWFGTSANISTINLTQFPYTGNLTIRFNSFGGTLDSGATLGTEGPTLPRDNGSVRVVGNIFGRWDDYCINGATYQDNIFVDNYGGGAGDPLCGGTGNTLVANYSYVNSSGGSGMDYHLTSSPSPADNFVPTNVPYSDLAIDIDDRTRPAGPARDAGASER